jgi:hypothetical protein
MCFVVVERLLTEGWKGDAQYGCIGLDEAVGTIVFFLAQYFSTTLRPPQRILAFLGRNVKPVHSLERECVTSGGTTHLRGINTSHAYVDGLILQLYNGRACIRDSVLEPCTG